MFRRTAPLLHVHDFHVQHSPKLHLDPAKAMHKSVRQAAPAAPAAAPDKLSRITAEKSQHSSLCHLTIQQSIKRSARSRPIWQLSLSPTTTNTAAAASADATIINLIRNLSIVHFSPGAARSSQSNTRSSSRRWISTRRERGGLFHVAYSRHRLASGRAERGWKSVTLKIERKKKKRKSEASSFVSAAVLPRRDTSVPGAQCKCRRWEERSGEERGGAGRQIQRQTPPACTAAGAVDLGKRSVGWASRASSSGLLEKKAATHLSVCSSTTSLSPVT